MNRDKALHKLKSKFIKNGYSQNLIESKIDQIKSLNFSPNPKNKETQNSMA